MMPPASKNSTDCWACRERRLPRSRSQAGRRSRHEPLRQFVAGSHECVSADRARARFAAIRGANAAMVGTIGATEMAAFRLRRRLSRRRAPLVAPASDLATPTPVLTTSAPSSNDVTPAKLSPCGRRSTCSHRNLPASVAVRCSAVCRRGTRRTVQVDIGSAVTRSPMPSAPAPCRRPRRRIRGRAVPTGTSRRCTRHVQVRAADTAAVDADQRLVRPGFGIGSPRSRRRPAPRKIALCHLLLPAAAMVR
jgi:hypothetical protein